MFGKKESATERTEYPVRKSEEEWRHILTPDQYHVAREAGTERPFANKYWDHHAEGIYRCAACGNELFGSETKFESGTGWPSFWRPMRGEAVEEHDDSSFLMRRTEIRCSQCGSHLGHVFPDGPAPTGLRYCMNSASLSFQEERRPAPDDSASDGGER